MDNSTLTFKHSNSDQKRHSVRQTAFTGLATNKQPKHIISGDQQDLKMGYIGDKKKNHPVRIEDGSNTSLMAHIQGPFEYSVRMKDSVVSVSDTESQH